MTYLNDVEDGGFTNFDHYKIQLSQRNFFYIILQAIRVTNCLAHSGGVEKKGTKYIITGWMHFPFKEF